MAGPWEKYQQPGQPQLVPVAPPDPFKVRDQQLQEEAARRAEEDQRFQREKHAAEMRMREREISQKPSGEEDVKLQQKRASLESLVTQINRVDELYRKGFKDEAYGFLSSLSEYLPSDEAAQLNAAGAGLAEQGLSAFRVPGVGAQSDAELRQFVEANRPSSWDRDAALEEKLRQLRARVDATRAEMGLPPAQWGAQSDQDRGSDHVLAVTQGSNGEGGPVAPAQDYRTVDDPALTGLKGEYLRRLASGQSAKEIIQWAKSAGVPLDAGFVRSVGQQVQFRRANPHVDVSHYDVSAFDDRVVPTTGFQRNMTAAAQSGPGAMAVRAGNAVTMNNLDSIVGMTGGNAEQARIAIEDAGRQNPGWALAGDIAGGVTAAMGGEAALAARGMAPGFGRGLLADTLYGAGAGAGAADGGNRLEGAGIGMVAGFGGNLAGNAIARGTGNLIAGVTDPSVQSLRRMGTPLTIGQAVGRSGRVGEAIKGAEDRLSGLTGVGDMINARRMEGVRAMNAKAFDKALEPIGQTVGGKIGEEGVEEAHGLVQQAFREALQGKAAQLDVDFVSGTAQAIDRLRRIRRDNLGEEVVEQIEEVTRGYFDPNTGILTGENMQAMLASLRDLRQAYRNDPLGKRIGDEIRKIERAVEGMFERQAPEVMPRYNAAKQAFRRVSILSNAVNRGKQTEGVFTPGQLGMADRQNTLKYEGEIAAASGKGQFHDFQRDAQNVLPNKVPDSGTAGRLAMAAAPAVVGGTGGVAGFAAGDAQTGAATGLGLATITAALYTKQGQRALVALAAKRGDKARRAGQKIKDRARLIGAAGGAAAVQGTSSGQ